MISNAYNYFNLSINLDSEAYDIFIHEYYHHLQNVTTPLGAERLNYFVQLLGHVAQLGSDTNQINSPIIKWKEDNPTKEIACSIGNILDHTLMWRYLEKKAVAYDRFEKQDIESVLTVFSKEKDTVAPYYISTYKNSIVGYPIGGFVLSESSAFCVQQMFKDDQRKQDTLKPCLGNYEYELIPYLLSDSFENKNQIFLGSYLFSELAFSIGTPSSGFYTLWHTLNNLNYSLNDVVGPFNILKEKLQEDIESTCNTSLQLIDDIEQSCLNVSNEIGKLIQEQCRQLREGLKKRKENCYFLGNSLLDEENHKENIKSLIHTFPVKQLLINEKDKKMSTNLLGLYVDVIFSLISNPKSFIRIFKDQLDISREDNHIEKYRIEIRSDNKETNAVGYVLSTLNLDSFDLIILE